MNNSSLIDTSQDIALKSDPSSHINPLPSLYGVAVRPMILASGKPAKNLRYCVSSSVGLTLWHSSIKITSRRPNSLGLPNMLWIVARITGLLVSRSPAESE